MKKLVIVLGLLTPLVLRAASVSDIENRVTKETLSNGLRVLVYERHGIPTFTGVLGVRAGSADDPKGGTGLAHMFEHMAFKGTPVIGTRDFPKEQEIMRQEDALVAELQEAQRRTGVDPAALDAYRKRLKELEEKQREFIVKDEFDRIYSEAGCPDENASTGNDSTMYIASLPANRIELWFLMQSEQYKHPVLREFYTERDVVKEERRISDDTPDGKLDEEFTSAAFRAHPYHEPVVGWMEDLNQLTREMAADFHRIYYVPNNTVIAIVGDVDTKSVVALAEKYFGDAPAAPRPPVITTVEPPQRGERTVAVSWDAQPQFMMGFHKPTYPNRDAYVVDLISSLLTGGRSSRLYERLVKTERKVSEIGSYAGPGRRFDNLIIFGATPVAPATSREVIAEIHEELDRLGREPVSAEELQKVVNQTRAAQVGAVATNRFAYRLLINELLYDDWRVFFQRDDVFASVQPKEIQNAARKYFTQENCTIGEIVQPSAGEEVAHEK